MSIFLLTNAFGALLGMAISPVAKDPNLTWMYIGLCVGSFIAGIVFWILFRKYNAAEDSMNELDGHGNKPIPLERVPKLPLTYKVSKFDLRGLERAGESEETGGKGVQRV